MKTQLVLQWQEESSNIDFEGIVEIEEMLRRHLPKQQSYVDGHDYGSGEGNIFILTDDPQLSFKQVERILSTDERWADVRVAYRPLSGHDFTIIWPKGLTEFNVI
jgi:hypothetical protein